MSKKSMMALSTLLFASSLVLNGCNGLVTFNGEDRSIRRNSSNAPIASSGDAQKTAVTSQPDGDPQASPATPHSALPEALVPEGGVSDAVGTILSTSDIKGNPISIDGAINVLFEPETPPSVVNSDPKPEGTPPLILLNCATAVLPELARSATTANMNTILRTLTALTFAGADGPFETFPLVDTEPEFEKWIARNLATYSGQDMPYLDAWCHRLGGYSSDPENLSFKFASAGEDGVMGTLDDIIMEWKGFDL